MFAVWKFATDLNPYGDGRIFPAGSLRESLRGLSRANAIVLTRMNLVSREKVDAIKTGLRNMNSDAPIFELETHLHKITKLEDFLADRLTPDNDEDRQAVTSAFVFCGLGNPESFLTMLKEEGFNVVGHRNYGDHKAYRQSDAIDLGSNAQDSGARFLLTTAKDAVKLEKIRFDLPVFVVETTPKINEMDAFVRIITPSYS
ncbi:tetraacyldisaccharide 4'-kinase [Leptolyngbya sp. 7M]|uniref:tetraacyldisaccharide 4'-kinase n=1 Tax=Leptolyngbya sp. 7M TaxID=2812896 RepID=UPI001B8D8289|nr:tetraacyldisaccharide 4'-kinase [Leptolyngbya sp. 7M]QYO68250.1 tetraacyldisaccharide 4'-kinase [Leptolyngbya sp. 7M]